jgi:hypothetical protein
MERLFKILILMIALNVAVAYATLAIAVEVPTTKSICKQAGMRWKEKKEKCVYETRKKPMLRTEVRNVLGIIGLSCNFLGLIWMSRIWIDDERKARNRFYS